MKNVRRQVREKIFRSVHGRHLVYNTCWEDPRCDRAMLGLDNYFWKLYFWGRYMPDCCPNYLQATHFSALQARVRRIVTHTASLQAFLENNPGAYTHFVLLDHQDWLAAHLKPALEAEWELIFQNAAPGAKVLLRTASPDINFIPPRFMERIHWDRELAAAQHRLDRVGTYAGVWIGTIL